MPITAGSITITRRINTGDYSHKEAKVDIHYQIDGTDNPNAVIDGAQHQAVRALAQALATVVTIKHTPEIVVDGVVSFDQLEAEQLNQTEAPQKRHRRTKAEMAAANGADVAENTSATGTNDWPLGPGPVADGVAPIPQAQLTDDPPEDWGPAVAEISDKELNAACNQTNHRIKNKPAIQGIIQRFTDGDVASIPQAQRAKFLTELQTL
jgi:hypothetical protein